MIEFKNFGSVEKLIANVIKKSWGNQSSPILIAIGGPGGSGKTTFAYKLKKRLGDAEVISLDNYKIPRHIRIAQDTWGPHPAANDFALIEQHLKNIRSGNGIEVPSYDIHTGCSSTADVYSPKKFNIIEGEVSTYTQIVHLFDFAIFIDSDFKTQLYTRITRDINGRGHSYEKAVTNFLKSNIREFSVYGADSKQNAHVCLFSNDDYSLTIDFIRNDYVSLFDSCVDSISNADIRGLIVPLTTPFESNGDICKEALIDHLQWLAINGVTRVLVSGTTAEFFSMTALERLQLLDIVRDNFPGIVLFQAGDNCLSSSKELLLRAVRHGADGVMVLPPYYFSGLPEQGIIDYFKRLSEICSVPFILYNFPKHTGNALTAKILSSVPHFGVKDSTGDCGLIPHTPQFLAGSSTKVVEACKQGAGGFVSALANVFPELYTSMEKELYAHHLQDALDRQQLIIKKKESFPSIPEIILLKKILKKTLNGYPDYVRLPLVDYYGELTNL